MAVLTRLGCSIRMSASVRRLRSDPILPVFGPLVVAELCTGRSQSSNMGFKAPNGQRLYGRFRPPTRSAAYFDPKSTQSVGSGIAYVDPMTEVMEVTCSSAVWSVPGSAVIGHLTPHSAARPAIIHRLLSDRSAQMSDFPSWHIVGDWFDNCSCAVPCPCTFAQAPDNGFCESVLFWHVREGYYRDVRLDNLSFVRVGRWGGDLWARQATGVAGLYIDDHRRPRGWLSRLGQRVLRRRAAEPWHRESPDHLRDCAEPRALGGRHHRQSEGLGQGDRRANQPAGDISAADKRAGQRKRARAAGRDVGEVDHPIGRRARLQV